MGRLTDKEMRLRVMPAEERIEYGKIAQHRYDGNREFLEASHCWIDENRLFCAEYRHF